MPPDHDSLIIVTGGPGAGKTTLIERLSRAGFAVSSQAGRAIVRDQLRICGPALPWLNTPLFDELVLSWGMRSYRNALERKQTVFFDQAIPCVAGYIRAHGRQIPPHIVAAVTTFRYNRMVFVAPPWRDIYHQDTERWETFERAEATHRAIVETYAKYGYWQVELPRSDVESRFRFVVQHLARRGGPMSEAI